MECSEHSRYSTPHWGYDRYSITSVDHLRVVRSRGVPSQRSAAAVPVQAGTPTAGSVRHMEPPCRWDLSWKEEGATSAKSGRVPADTRSATPVSASPGCAASCGRPRVLSSAPHAVLLLWVGLG